MAFDMWVDRDVEKSGIRLPHTTLHPHFSRRWRKWQAPWLYRRLLRQSLPIYVPTASYFDLRAVAWAAPGRLAPGQAFFYFHKLRLSPARAQALARLAQHQPDLELFGTSDDIVNRLRTAGFARVARVIPVLDAQAAPDHLATPFRHLLYAGAARADKGFSTVVDMIERLAGDPDPLPVCVQTSGDHYGRHDEQTTADLRRLAPLRFAGLNAIGDTLDAAQYRALFPGSICLQAYSPHEYADKMSAVIFDALRAGAPVINLAGTSMAAIVGPAQAGIVLDDTDPARWLEAARRIRADYAAYSARAAQAGAGYSAANAWAPLVEALRRSAATAQA